MKLRSIDDLTSCPECESRVIHHKGIFMWCLHCKYQFAVINDNLEIWIKELSNSRKNGWIDYDEWRLTIAKEKVSFT